MKQKSTPWSKLQREIYKLLSPGLGLQIHCVAYRMGSRYGSNDLPRYWITLGKEIIWDYPRDFLYDDIGNELSLVDIYPYGSGISDISCLLREYIDSPKDTLLGKTFDKDKWGLTDLLKAADRRMGRERLKKLRDNSDNDAVHEIIATRLGGRSGAKAHPNGEGRPGKGRLKGDLLPLLSRYSNDDVQVIHEIRPCL